MVRYHLPNCFADSTESVFIPEQLTEALAIQGNKFLAFLTIPIHMVIKFYMFIATLAYNSNMLLLYCNTPHNYTI